VPPDRTEEELRRGIWRANGLVVALLVLAAVLAVAVPTVLIVRAVAPLAEELEHFDRCEDSPPFKCPEEED